MRGFIIGIIWGAVVAALAAGGLSLAIGFPDEDRTKPAPMAKETSQTVSAAKPDAVEDTPKAEQAATAGATTEVAETPEAPATAVQEETPVLSETPPIAETSEPTTTAPVVDASEPATTPLAETAVSRPSAPAAPLAAPASPGAVAVDSAAPAAPSVAPVDTVQEEATETAAPTRSAGSEDAPARPAAQALAPSAAAPDSGPVVSTDPARPPVVASLTPADETTLAEDTTETAPAGTSSEAAPVDDTDTTETLPADTAEATDGAETSESAEEPRVSAVAPSTTGPSIGKPAGSLINRPTAVPQTRLPRISTTEEAPAQAPATASLPAASAVPEQSPLVAFAAPANAPADVPRVSVVLIDRGDSPLGPAMLDGFPFPLSVALDPSHPDARSAAEAYRAAGVEVLALADIPEGAQPSDVEVALAGSLDAVPGAVALLEDPNGGVQASRAISAQVTSFLLSSGHGLVTQPKGLNTAQQLAAREGVPSVTLFRDFDGAGQNKSAVGRFLQNGALRARQEGAVVMMGRMKADTLTALIQWGLQDGNEALALVPISVILRESVAQ